MDFEEGYGKVLSLSIGARVKTTFNESQDEEIATIVGWRFINGIPYYTVRFDNNRTIEIIAETSSFIRKGYRIIGNPWMKGVFIHAFQFIY